MTCTRFDVMVAQMVGAELPPLPPIPGRRIVARDEPLQAHYLVDVTSAGELALLLGCSRPAAYARLKRNAPNFGAVGAQTDCPTLDSRGIDTTTAKEPR